MRHQPRFDTLQRAVESSESMRGGSEILRRLGGLLHIVMSCSAGAAPTIVYEIGPVTGQEQLYIELINRARLNPAQEGKRLAALSASDEDVASAVTFFGVNLELMKAEMAGLPSAPPLAPNRLLREAAVKHSRDMATTGVQTHTGSDGSTIGQRVKREGYNFNLVTENIYTTSAGGEQAHAGFVIDWGNDGGTGGMQNGRGHRLNVHDPRVRELGIGVVNTNRPGVGPEVVTQVFGKIDSSGPFVTGVAFHDLDGNSFYSPDEGIGGVTVTVAGNTFSARTAAAGGFAIPLPGDGLYELTFRARGMRSEVRNFSVSGSANTKIDLQPVYMPRVSGPQRLTVGASSAYRIAAVAGASGYRVLAGRLRAASKHDAEDGLGRAEASQTGTYSVAQSQVVAQGAQAFHLAHPTNADQLVLLKTKFVPSPTGQLVFRSRLGFATTGQSAVVEVFADGRWQEVFRQNGTGSTGELFFREVALDLAEFASREIRVRFRYDAIPGAVFFPQTTAGVGWYFDDIRLPGVKEIFADRTLETGLTRKVSFAPIRSGAWWLRAQAKVSGKFLRTGPGRIVQAAAP